MVSSSSSVSQISCCVRNCSSCDQHIYHGCKAKLALGYELKASSGSQRPGSGILIDRSHLCGTNSCGALNAISHLRAPTSLSCQGKKCLVRGQMESLWQDKGLNHLPGIKHQAAFPLAMGLRTASFI